MKFLVALLTCFILPITFAQPLIIGTSGDNPPFASFADDKNNFYGFEIDIMLEICKRIGAQCEFKAIIVSEVVDQLSKGAIDFAIASIIILPKKPPGFIFSLPYLSSKAQFITTATSSINKIEDIYNKTVGVRRGTLYYGAYFKQVVTNLFTNKIKIVEYLNINDLMYALKNGDVDADLCNEETAKYWYINNKDQYKLIGDSIPVGEGYAILSTSNKAAVMAQINRALVQMEEDGGYVKIYTRYF